MIAPSGRKFLDEHPGMVWVICDRCFDPKGLDREAAKKGRLAAAPGVILEELMNVTVNYRGVSN